MNYMIAERNGTRIFSDGAVVDEDLLYPPDEVPDIALWADAVRRLTERVEYLERDLDAPQVAE